MSNRGRKSLWVSLDMESKIEAVKGWALDGSTDEEMCKMLGISHETFYKWKREKPEFTEAIKKGKYIANGELINSAFTQATGYRYKEQVVTNKGNVVEIERYAQPSATMLIFLLKNRLPERYRDKQEVDVDVSGQVKTVNEQKTHIIHEIIADPDVAKRIRENYRQRIGDRTSTE